MEQFIFVFLEEDILVIGEILQIMAFLKKYFGETICCMTNFKASEPRAGCCYWRHHRSQYLLILVSQSCLCLDMLSLVFVSRKYDRTFTSNMFFFNLLRACKKCCWLELFGC